MKLTVPSVLSVDFEWQQSWWWIFFVNFHDVVDSWIVDSQSLSVCQHDYILNDCVFLHPVAHKKSTKLNHRLNIEAPTVYMNIDKTFGIVCNSNVFDSIIKSTQNELNIYPNDTNIDTLCVCVFFLSSLEAIWSLGRCLWSLCERQIKWKGAIGRNFVWQIQ